MTGSGFLDFAFLVLRDFLRFWEDGEGLVSSQVGGARCQKGVVDVTGVGLEPVLKEYPSCVLQEEGEARLGGEFAGQRGPSLYALGGDADDIPEVLVEPVRVQRAPKCCRFRGIPST